MVDFKVNEDYDIYIDLKKEDDLRVKNLNKKLKNNKQLKEFTVKKGKRKINNEYNNIRNEITGKEKKENGNKS